MILVCPECSTRYEVDAAKFPAAGRKVRCAKCGHVWHQAGPDSDQAAIEQELFEQPSSQDEPAPAESVPPEPAAGGPSVSRVRSKLAEQAQAAQAEPAASKPKGHLIAAVAMVFGWIGLVGTILIIGWAATNYREQIATIWPQSATLFARLGMGVNIAGIDFADIRHTTETEDGQPVLVITGRLVNVSGEKKSVPPLAVTLSDDGHHPVYNWRFTAMKPMVEPGQSVGFKTRLSNPPASTRHVEIRFADASK